MLSVLEFPFVILSWTDYYWNLMWKTISGISSFFALPAILTMPITWIHTFTLSLIVYIKYNVIDHKISFADAIRINLSRFPEL